MAETLLGLPPELLHEHIVERLDRADFLALYGTCSRLLNSLRAHFARLLHEKEMDSQEGTERDAVGGWVVPARRHG